MITIIVYFDPISQKRCQNVILLKEKFYESICPMGLFDSDAHAQRLRYMVRYQTRLKTSVE